MGRPRIGKELKKPSDYVYDYPAQRELFKKLSHGDMKIITGRTGYSQNYISMMAAGKRKMNNKVRRLVETLIDFRKTLDEIL